jgi:predicted secreted protein
MKQSSQGTKFYVQTGLAAAVDVTDVTKAAPAVATLSAATGLAVKDVVYITGGNWRSIRERAFPISALVAEAATLFDSDTTEEAADFDPTGVKAQEVNFSEACMATLTFTSPAGTVIDVTTMCDGARETLTGLPAVSTWQATGFWDASDPMQKVLRDLYRNGQNVVFKVVFNDGSGLVFRGSVNQFTITAAVDQAVAFTIGGNITGPITDLEVDPAALMAMQGAPAPAPMAQAAA